MRCWIRACLDAGGRIESFSGLLQVGTMAVRLRMLDGHLYLILNSAVPPFGGVAYIADAPPWVSIDLDDCSFCHLANRRLPFRHSTITFVVPLRCSSDE